MRFTMKAILLTILSLSFAYSANATSCHYGQNKNLIMTEADLAEFKQNVELTLSANGFELKEMSKQNIDAKTMYSYATKKSKLKRSLLNGAINTILFFTPDDAISECDKDLDKDFMAFKYNLENIEVYTAKMLELSTGKSCTQTVSINKRADFNEEKLTTIFGNEVFYEDDPADTFVRLYGKPVCN